MKRKEWRVLLLLAIAFVLKLAVGLYFFQNYEIKDDAQDYYEYAEIIQEQGPFFTNIEDLEAFAPPGFPWILALLMKLTNRLGSIVFLNALLSTGTVYLIYKISLQLLPRNWALAAMIYSMIFIPYYLYIGTILKESLLQFLVPLSVLLFFKGIKSKSYGISFFLGFVLVYLIHTDERFLLLVPLFILSNFFYNKHQGRSHIFRSSFLLILSLLIFSAPWMIRNFKVYNRPIIITERFQSPIDRILEVENRSVRRAEYFKERLVSFRDSTQSGFDPVPKMGRERAVLQSINDGLVPHDFSLAERVYFNSLGYWSPIRTRGILIYNGWKYKGARTPFQNILYMCNFGILLPFLLLGIFMALRRKTGLAIFLSVYLLLHSAIHVFIIFGSGRYRHPVDFIIIILAFFGFYQIKKMTRKPDAVEK